MQQEKQMQTPTCRTVRSSEARPVSLESIYDRTCNPTDPQTRKESEGKPCETADLLWTAQSHNRSQ